MALKPELLTQDPAAADIWVGYALATLIRAIGYGNNAYIQQWTNWAGGTGFRYTPRQPDPLSGVVYVTDGNAGILAMEGTLNAGQLAAQVAESGQVVGVTPGRTGSVSSYDWWYTQQMIPVIRPMIAALPITTTISIAGHSLGGAVALCLCWPAVSPITVGASLVSTFGQPRAGNGRFLEEIETPYIRWCVSADPVQNIPPDSNTLAIVGTLATLGFRNYNYTHSDIAAHTVTTEGLVTVVAGPALVPTYQSYLQAILRQQDAPANVAQWHYIKSYANLLGLAVNNYPVDVDTAALFALNNQMNAVDQLNVPVPPPDIARIPVPAILADPNIVIANAPQMPAVPNADLGEDIQVVGMAGAVVLPAPFGPILPPFVAGAGMATIKYTIIFQQNNYGWTETYYWTGDNVTTPDARKALGRTLCQARIGLAGSNAQITSCRNALVSVPAVYPTQRSSLIEVFATPYINGNAARTSDPPESAMILQHVAGPTVPTKLVYMRGIPDDFVQRGGLPAAGGPAVYFGADWTAWVNFHRNTGWGWLGKLNNPATSPLTSLVQAASGKVTFTTTDNVMPILAVGRVVEVRFHGLNQPRSLNGVHPVQVVTPSSGVTKRRIGILPWDSQSGAVTFNGIQFNATSDIQFLRIGERKAGRPLNSSRGRARVRATD